MPPCRAARRRLQTTDIVLRHAIRRTRLINSPDLLVFVAIPVAGIELVLGASVLVDVFGGKQMYVRDVAAWLFAGERPVHFIDHDPALKVERLGDGGGLILLVANALESWHGAVTRRDLLREAIGRINACRLQ